MDVCKHEYSKYLPAMPCGSNMGAYSVGCLEDEEVHMTIAFSADSGGDDGDYGGRPGSGEAQSGVCVIL